jgi:hypothetical protein
MNDMGYLLGWTLKGVVVAIILGLIIKLVAISLNKKKSKEFGDNLSKNKSAIIIWFFPVVFSLMAVAMVVGMYSDNLIRDNHRDTANVKKFGGNAGTIDGVE